MENKEMARDQQGTDREYDTRGQGMGETRGSTQNQEKKVIKINTRVPKVPQWLKIDHTMKLRIPIKKAKELANRILEMDDDVDVNLRFMSGDRGSVNFRYEPINAPEEQGDGEKSGWEADKVYSQKEGSEAAGMGSQAKGEKEAGWRPGVQMRSSETSGEGSFRGESMESGTEQTSRDASEESMEETRAEQGMDQEEEMEEGDISTVMSVECTPYDQEEDRQPG